MGRAPQCVPLLFALLMRAHAWSASALSSTSAYDSATRSANIHHEHVKQNLTTMSSWPRRNFLSSLLDTASASGCLITASFPRQANAAETVESSNSLCRPKSKKQRSQIENTRSQIDLAVQASSVQAWSSAADIVGDPLLDESSLATLLDSCNLTERENGTLREAFQNIERMRAKLSGIGNGALRTEDAMDVMRYGTTARSAIDSVFAIDFYLYM